MKIQYFFLLVLLLIVPFTSATSASLKPVVQDTCTQLIVQCGNCNYVNLSVVTFPNGSQQNYNLQMQQSTPTDYNYTLCDTHQNGDYSYTAFGDVSGTLLTASGNFIVTPNGQELSTGTSVIFSFVILLLAAVIVFGVYGLVRAKDSAWTIFYICLLYLSFFSLAFVGWQFSFYYLWTLPIITSVCWIAWLTLAICFMPFIYFMSLYIIKKEALDALTKDYQTQGYSPTEARDLARQDKRKG